MTAASEPTVKANSAEALQLYQRGVAAARAGQKRVAAVMLTRSLQLDPHSELGWLWLSGVLDDPAQRAFCLDAVLKLNPNNQHAQKGLRLLKEREQLTVEAAPAPGLTMPTAPAQPTTANGAEARHESWWVGWRHRRRDTSRFRLLLWAFPIALVVLALVIHESFAFAVARVEAIQPTPAVVAEIAYSAVSTVPTIEPILEAEPLGVAESLAAGYLSALDPLRAELREATKAYRAATSQPGGASVGHVAATQRLHATVEATLTRMDQLRPPGTLQQAHDDYVRGMELQRDGLDAMLAFYSGYNVANANRAALHFQQARAFIERAQTAFVGQARQLAELSAISSQTAR